MSDTPGSFILVTATYQNPFADRVSVLGDAIEVIKRGTEEKYHIVGGDNEEELISNLGKTLLGAAGSSLVRIDIKRIEGVLHSWREVAKTLGLPEKA